MEWDLEESDESDSVDRHPDWVKTPNVKQRRSKQGKANNSEQVKVLGVENVNCCTLPNWIQLLKSTIFCMRTSDVLISE